MDEPVLCHIVDQASWKDRPVQAVYEPASLETEGFVHLSPLSQVCRTAARFYAGRDDLLLLILNTERLTSPVRWEDLYGHGAFPHLYGSLNTDAVTLAIPFPCHNDGSFTLPDQVKIAYAC